MNTYSKHMYLLFLFFIIGTGHMFAQEIQPKQEINIDDLGNVSDEFQELFFEALKQRAITNYDKAIEALNKCVAIDSEPDYLYLELGKNYLELKLFQKAEENFKKVIAVRPEDKFVLEYLFTVYFQEHKYKESIEVVEKLVTFDSMFKEQLANLYIIEERYDDGLTVLDELDEEFGRDSYRDSIRRRITSKLTNPNNQIGKLEQKIKDEPKVEQNYLNLIYLYSQDNKKQKAFETAKLLLEKKPKSELVHLALYKFYLDQGKVEKAITSMKIALKGEAVDPDSKYKVINDFLSFLDINPQYESQLEDVLSGFSSQDNTAKIFTELGNYFYKKNKKEQALNFYERGIKETATDFELLKRILFLQVDLERYSKALEGSNLALELFPAQPIFYLVNGVSLLNLGKVDQALEILNTGIDYVIDDKIMEADFYKQISSGYQKKGDTTKALEYQQKVHELQKKS
ncbi:tetratricopeptide repeat protein [Aquimarina pacifica]|uniref:tetratricopeptide repeat protein n=1 Tax=Aquimarina pacifica TaxID=1296415 RepID=UPI0005567108|nr:tetratricopeptide repeat protein [Aquimarina pacifica]